MKPHTSVNTITTAEEYFGNIHCFPVNDQLRRYLSCLGKAYDLRAMFMRAISEDSNTFPCDNRSEVLDPLDTVISALSDHYLHYSIVCALPDEHTFAEMSKASEKGGMR